MYKLINLESFSEKQSMLVALQKGANCPFEIKRVFYIFGVPSGGVRGQHANKNSQFFFIALQGQCKIKVDNGLCQEVLLLDSPTRGLYLDKMLWKEMYDFSKDCILMVLSDCYYDKEEYIYNYSAYCNAINTMGGGGANSCYPLSGVA